MESIKWSNRQLELLGWLKIPFNAEKPISTEQIADLYGMITDDLFDMLPSLDETPDSDFMVFESLIDTLHPYMEKYRLYAKYNDK